MSQANKKPISTSVVVAAKNEAANISACLASLLAGQDEETEVIVVDDGSSDDTAHRVTKLFPQVKLLSGLGVGPGAARNLALKEALGEFVAFIDADAVAQEDCIKILRHKLLTLSPEIAGIGGRQKTYAQANLGEKQAAEFLSALSGVSDYLHGDEPDREVAHNPSCNVMYRVQVLRNAGGFCETLWPCEDLELDIRLKKSGYRLWYTAQAVVEHRRPQNLRQVLSMMFRYGFGHGQLTKIHGLCQNLHLLPVLAVIASFGGVFLLLYLPVSCMLALLGVLVMTILYWKTLLGYTWSKSLRFAVWLYLAVMWWLWGFFKARFTSLKVAKS